MHPSDHVDRPFPLKKYYLLYAGVGSAVFYVLLFFLFIKAERQAMYDEYIYGVTQRANIMYQDIARDFLRPHGVSIDEAESFSAELRAGLREEIEEIVESDFNLAQVKLFSSHALTLYNHMHPEEEGHVYEGMNETSFTEALRGHIQSELETEEDGRRLIEAYLPIRDPETQEVLAVLEVYEDVTRFEAHVAAALKRTLIPPTIVFIAFNLILYLVVSRADNVIADRTNRLVTIRKNMEKYLSQTAVSAITQAVSDDTELFAGERQDIVIMFSDIRGFTSFSEGLKPEKVVHTLNRLLELQSDIIHQHGGVIDKYVGDEIMVAFPAGSEAEAVSAALEMLKEIKGDPELELSVGIGIHAGSAVVGSIGASNRRDYTAIGDTVNTAARICSACPKEEVYISAAVFEHLPADLKACFQAEPVSLDLKGKSMPVEVRRLLCLS